MTCHQRGPSDPHLIHHPGPVSASPVPHPVLVRTPGAPAPPTHPGGQPEDWPLGGQCPCRRRQPLPSGRRAHESGARPGLSQRRTQAPRSEVGPVGGPRPVSFLGSEGVTVGGQGILSAVFGNKGQCCRRLPVPTCVGSVLLMPSVPRRCPHPLGDTSTVCAEWVGSVPGAAPNSG